jgi:quercetin 2,3-dioxygenase
MTMSQRSIKKVHVPVRDDIADLMTRRALPTHSIERIDPFLFLNHHGHQVYPPGNRGLPFGPHPHRGFETVTFILKGDIAHHDTGGHSSVIEAGGVQWMTAGRGLVHSEVSSENFKQTGGELEILQLWVNLPAKLKMTNPRYIGLQRNEIPRVQSDDGKMTVHLIAGSFKGVNGPIKPLTDIEIMTIEFESGASETLQAPSRRNVFFYLVSGKIRVNDDDVQAPALVEFDDGGEDIRIESISPGVLLFGHATPYREAVVAHGPFVMNTREEILEAIRDYQAGKFQ